MLQIVTYPSDVLVRSCDPVTEFGQDLKILTDQMAEAMYASNGVGLAAPQVNVSKRIILVDPSGGEDAKQLKVMVNPVITWLSPEKELNEEGCLSLPGVVLSVPRSTQITVKYHDVAGSEQTLSCSAWQARIVQHEVDHLDGQIMLSRVGRGPRLAALKKLEAGKRR